MTQDRHAAEVDIRIRDPDPTTPFEVVDQSGLLRLRRYAPGAPRPGVAPLLLVYPMIKRPYVLDLLPSRSVVRNFLRQGFTVYLTDWLPPRLADRNRGVDAYVNGDLARAVDQICRLESEPRVSLIGCCCAGLLSAIYAALNPDKVRHLVTFAAPFETEPPLAMSAARQIVYAYGNVPDWMVGSVLNVRMRDPEQIAFHLARDLGESELVQPASGETADLLRAVRPWLASDIPIAGRLFLDIVGQALPNADLLESRMDVGGRRVALEAIRCPVLAIAGARDVVVPPQATLRFADRVGSLDATSLVFPSGHLGLMLSLAAQQKLWPEVGAWLESRSAEPLRQTA